MYKLIDMMSQIDLSFLEELSLEEEIEKLSPSLAKKKRWTAKEVAMLSSIAAGSIALTTILVIFYKKNGVGNKVA